MEEALLKDSNTFLLNHLLMSVQFFENYDRDIELLRQNWFKDFSMESHKKKCFYGDTVFRLVGKKVRFAPPQGMDKNLASQLHPLRLYVSSDNVEAAYVPSALNHNQLNIEPHYLFTVKPADGSEQSGNVTLVEFRKKEVGNKPKRSTLANVSELGTSNASEITQGNPMSNCLQQKCNLDDKHSSTIQKMENSMDQNADVKPKISGRASSFRFFPRDEATIPANGFYKYTTAEEREKLKRISDFRMNSPPTTAHEIPQKCFQIQERKLKVNLRRNAFTEFFGAQRVLNAAAFKGYFCDLLIEKLSDSLDLDSAAVNESLVSDEFIIVNQAGTQLYISPVIPITDWNSNVEMNKKYQIVGRMENVVWPSKCMQKIINLLPCDAVPTAQSHSEENVQNEKIWSLSFHKAEEFLLLHMMHAHLRCYLFVVLLYKSFIEKEINTASFGPRHLMHLLFWRVHKNFFAWPEDRPAETLLNYLKTLYRKLQNKSLSDFFITSRNLFAGSFTRDLHKAQALIKKILEDPVLYISRAVRNLHFETDFYPQFDILKLSAVLDPTDAKTKSRRMRKEKREKWVRRLEEENLVAGGGNEELGGKADEQEQLPGLSGSVDFEKKGLQVLEMFVSHFLQMGLKSLEYNFLNQALFYLNQSDKLFEMIQNKETNQNNLKATAGKINELKVICSNKLKKDFPKLPSKQFQAVIQEPKKISEDVPVEEEKKCKESIVYQPKQQERDVDEVFTVKL